MRKRPPGRFLAEKVCTDPECPLAGRIQPASSFNPIGPSLGGGTVGVCKICHVRHVLDNQAKHRENERKYRENVRIEQGLGPELPGDSMNHGPRPKRHLDHKECERCGTDRRCAEFPKVRGGGTADVCNACKSIALSKALAGRTRVHKRPTDPQVDHLQSELIKRRRQWDSLPDGHPYKSPNRP